LSSPSGTDQSLSIRLLHIRSPLSRPLAKEQKACGLMLRLDLLKLIVQLSFHSSFIPMFLKDTVNRLKNTVVVIILNCNLLCMIIRGNNNS
jgi:hypothetical protein